MVNFLNILGPAAPLGLERLSNPLPLVNSQGVVHKSNLGHKLNNLDPKRDGAWLGKRFLLGPIELRD